MGRTLMVLGGGGALGAYQAGALLALAEQGVLPDALFGCSAGALNAAFLASDPGLPRTRELAAWWADTRTHSVLSPSKWSRVRGFAAAATTRADALFDERPLRRLISEQVRAHDLSELALPLSVTTTCLDCGAARHHDRGPAEDVLVASCSLPGLFSPVRLPDGHLHVDGGVVCGVPLQAALDDAGPEDSVVVLDCGFAPVTGLAGGCAGITGIPGAELEDACGLTPQERRYVAPTDSGRGVLDVVLRAFTVARAVANTASTAAGLADPRVRVVPHVADAFVAGLLSDLPAGPRDLSRTQQLVDAGHAATALWLPAQGLVAQGPAAQGPVAQEPLGHAERLAVPTGD